MFVRITTDPTPRPNSLRDLGMTSDSNPLVSLSEFSYKKGTEIYGEKEPAEYVYQVRSGAVRSYKLLSDGRRQIGAFHLVGDIFGLENGAAHRFTTEAIVETTVRLIKRQSLEIVAESDAMVAKNLLCMTSSNLQHAEDHMLLLGRKTSLEKVATFLLEMGHATDGCRRHGAADVAARYCRLPGPHAGNRIASALAASRPRRSRLPRQHPAPDRAAGQTATHWSRSSELNADPPGAIEARCCSVLRSTSNSTAVDQPNSRMPFIAVIGPSRRHAGTGVISP